MEIYLIVILFCINHLQVIWLLNNRRYLSKLHASILSTILILTIGISFMDNTLYSALALSLFYGLFIFFILDFLGSWLLTALLLFLINSLIIISWLFTYDLLHFLFHSNYISNSLYRSLFPISLVGEQLFLLFLIFLVNYFDKKYKISESISTIPKSYNLQSIIALFFLLFFSALKQLAVMYFVVESFIYLTILLLTLNLIFYMTAYSYSRYYQQQLKKKLLFEQYNQELEKVVISDEFRHDYRNILLSLVNYIEKGESQKALNYIASITDYSRDVMQDDPYTTLSNLSIPPAQGLLVYLIETCKKKEIQLQLDISSIIFENDISIYLIDFLRCLSSLFDYAVDKTTISERKKLLISMKKENSRLYIELTNTFNGTNIENYVESKDYYTSHGLTILTKIPKQYEGSSFSLRLNQNDFIALLTFPVNSSTI